MIIAVLPGEMKFKMERIFGVLWGVVVLKMQESSNPDAQIRLAFLLRVFAENYIDLERFLFPIAVYS